MERHPSDDVWAPEEVAEEQTAAGHAAVALSQPEVLARLPDLDAMQPQPEDNPKPRRRDGRILSGRSAVKLLLGVGVVLVLIAVVPRLLRDRTPQGGRPPAPDADEAPAWSPQTADSSDATSIPPSISYEPNMSFTPDLPPAPDFIEAIQVPEVDPSVALPASGGQDQAAATGMPGQAPPAEHQSQTRVAQPQALANQQMAISGPNPAPAGVYADQYIQNHQAESQAASQAQGPAPSTPQYAGEPGIARLEGTIERLPVRTTYDAARSSIH